MTHRGLFQPLTFCDSVILCFPTLFTQDKQACVGPLLLEGLPRSRRTSPGRGAPRTTAGICIVIVSRSKKSCRSATQALFGGKQTPRGWPGCRRAPLRSRARASQLLLGALKHHACPTSASPPAKSLTCRPCGSQLRTHWLSSSKPWVQLYMPSKTGGGGSHSTGTQRPSSHCPLSRHWSFRNFLRRHKCQAGLQPPEWPHLSHIKHPTEAEAA